MSDLIQTELKNHCLEIGINRPDKKNALNLDMYRGMSAALREVENSEQIRCALIKGVPGCFTGGNDLADFMNAPPELSLENPVVEFMFALKDSSKPIVAAVDGLAIGIGTTLLMHCDMVYATQNATFSLPFAKLGLSPEFASSFILPKLAGHAKASEWLMLGEAFSAEEALSAGIINSIVDDADAHARTIADKLVKQAPAALNATKALLKASDKETMNTAIEIEFKEFVRGLSGAEFREAVTAFFEKREADFFKPLDE